MAGTPVIRTGPTVAVGGGVSVITGSNKTTYTNSAFLKFSQGFNNEAYQSEQASGVWACGDQISHVLTDDATKGPDHVAAIGESVFAIGTTLGALGFYVEHNGGANPRWHHGSRSDYNGGFRWAIQDPTSTPDSGVAAGAGDTISFGGVVFDFSFTGNPENMFEGLASAMCWAGREISVDGGTSTPGNEIDFAGISTQDRSQTRSGTAPLTGNFYGHVVDLGGIIQLNGPVQIGNTDNVTVTYFLDKGIACQWTEAPVNDKFYRIDIAGSQTTVIMGDSATPDPVTIAGSTTKRWALDSSTSTPAAFTAYGCTFKGGADFDLGSTTTFDECIVQDVNNINVNALADLSGSTFIDAQLNYGLPPTTGKLTGAKLSNPGVGKYCMTVSQQQTSMYIDYDISVNAASGQAIEFTHAAGNIEISFAPGATTFGASEITVSGGGTVSFATSPITLQVTVLDDSTGLPIQNAHVYLHKVGTPGVALISGATNASGVISNSISYDADTDVYGWARQMDLAGTDYEAKAISGTYTSSGLSITVRLSPIA